MILWLVLVLVAAVALVYAALASRILRAMHPEPSVRRTVPHPPEGALKGAKPTYIVEGFDVRDRTATAWDELDSTVHPYTGAYCDVEFPARMSTVGEAAGRFRLHMASMHLAEQDPNVVERRLAR